MTSSAGSRRRTPTTSCRARACACSTCWAIRSGCSGSSTRAARCRSARSPPCMKHTRIQFETTTEKQFTPRRCRSPASRSTAARSTPARRWRTRTRSMPRTCPVLFELVRRGALPKVELPYYDHIVVDEAQLRAPMELAAIGDALAPAWHDHARRRSPPGDRRDRVLRRLGRRQARAARAALGR